MSTNPETPDPQRPQTSDRTTGPIPREHLPHDPTAPILGAPATPAPSASSASGAPAPEPPAPVPPAPEAPAPGPPAAPARRPGTAGSAARRTGPRTGPIVWGALILAFCGYTVQRAFGGDGLDTSWWIAATVIGLGLLLLGVGIAVVIRNRR
ncbi:hypothetical protein [Leucobacter sp. wl10]|uniref:hypothetical protein n=1 Tax=Leucobacter sp. wl10 TaxID=2304677 RepID=UPI000E5ADBD8|nr:hypothetical protein [Leucobacter sp. wl10]RGE19482.1 hypothetical protein D1J51_11535 [Leucobacter sp. wl10]